MEKNDFRKVVTDAVNLYIADEETYDDNAQLVVDPVSMKVEVAGDVTPEDMENAPEDYYDVMEFVNVQTDSNRWTPDAEAIAWLADQYFA